MNFQIIIPQKTQVLDAGFFKRGEIFIEKTLYEFSLTSVEIVLHRKHIAAVDDSLSAAFLCGLKRPPIFGFVAMEICDVDDFHF